MSSAVLDANVLVSGFVGFRNPDSTPGKLLRLWRAGQFHLIVSEHVLSELVRTLQKPYFQRRLTPEQISGGHALLRRRARLTSLTVQVQVVATHPEDDLVLATAVSGQVDYLVTGDTRLQQLVSYRGVTILSPRAFLGVLRQEADQ